MTFGTHVTGAPGVGRATVGTPEEPPVPIGPGAHTDRTGAARVGAWRLPPGMRVETRDVSVRWK
ncbi:hypothetical protein FRZ03_24720 [Streptomyces misionensis]|uniref:Uncharacterized protein n=1 Tax=Streptomyces misionensis TaxID=67331 RepID=A0A5C6J9W8_9ACTN|nr:hypothetical protein [Streptomyces misionensis]TWV37760.1 hypothetical protein FRZ03_24720 [Streptomyces misionensis]